MYCNENTARSEDTESIDTKQVCLRFERLYKKLNQHTQHRYLFELYFRSNFKTAYKGSIFGTVSNFGTPVHRGTVGVPSM